ncbi:MULTISPECIES: ring-opening amidohydrolase [Arthrobacter]|uniref:Cyclic amide hydrolase n=1 Tax=Arthrobacter terricola TaxID=2547396 RepID=A0A4V2ZSL7_9MICC|nr:MULTISPECIES: ring-opening amidohydrolase [Arthrobacter]MBT8159682.1 ring-opening amidohydrolase [Arthrobacter sp. GN70]TDF93634.1 ring-opening amidohydrolase [Arthrobacter terricola]
MRVEVHRLSMAHPGDVSGLQELVSTGQIEPTKIVATIGKTEGNGGANDFTRALATTSFANYLAKVRDQTPEEVTEQIAFVWSGGCEGVLSPHVTVFTRDDGAPGSPDGQKRLAISVQRTRDFLPEEVGRMAEVNEVADAVRRALDDLGSETEDVHYVQVKGPLLTPSGIADARARGVDVVTTDPNRSKAYARGATALGVAIALGEVSADQVKDEIIANDMTLYSNVASTSAGGELTSCEVIVFANSLHASSDYRIGHATLQDPIDIDGVRSALRNAGLQIECDPKPAEKERIAAVFAKAEAPLGGVLRGARTTMLSDADINYERHGRAAVGAVIASQTGDPRIFVSGGTEHQSPPAQAPISAIARI